MNHIFALNQKMKKMKIWKWWKNSSLLEKGISFVIVLSGIMLAAIGIAFLINPSFNIEHWGNFGDYFGSITGLLAFLGVLYTLLLSEKRTEEANERARTIHSEALKDAESAKSKADQRENELKEESIRREERDLFFKLLELHQEKLESIVYTFGIERYNGIQAFDKYAAIYNDLLGHFVCRFCIVKMGDKLEEKVYSRPPTAYEEAIISEMGFMGNKSKTDMDDTHSHIPIIQSYLKEHIYDFDLESTNIYYKERIKKIIKTNESLPSHFKIILDTENLYKAMIYISNYMYEKYGYIFSQYFRNMYYVLETCNEFKSEEELKSGKELKSKNEYYFKLFRAQLSRNEILLCLFNAVSDKSSTKLVQLLRDNEILDGLYHKDFCYTQNGERWKGRELELVNEILDLYLEEHNDQA